MEHRWRDTVRRKGYRLRERLPKLAREGSLVARAEIAEVLDAGGIGRGSVLRIFFPRCAPSRERVEQLGSSVRILSQSRIGVESRRSHLAILRNGAATEHLVDGLLHGPCPTGSTWPE